MQPLRVRGVTRKNGGLLVYRRRNIPDFFHRRSRYHRLKIHGVGYFQQSTKTSDLKHQADSGLIGLMPLKAGPAVKIP
jgi:hypothetical protein